GYEVLSRAGKATISKVVPGSEAWARGLKEGDNVVGERKNGNSLSVTIERGGKVYQANLTTTAAAPAAPSTVTPSKTLPLVGGTTLQRQLKVLSDHNVYLIIDKSGSMATRDCAGGVSRWKWCADQTHNLTEAASSYGCLDDGITIVLFSDAYTVYRNASVR